MYCSTCKHWQSENSMSGECRLIDYLQRATRSKPQEQPNVKGFGLFVDAADDTGLVAELITGANFGCTLHEVD